MSDPADRRRPEGRPDVMGGPDRPSDVIEGGEEAAGENPDVMASGRERAGENPDVLGGQDE